MANILTVDDSASVRQAIKIALLGKGHAVSEAVDGADGVSKVEAQSFDLILTDLNMPNMNGLEMIRTLRKNPKHLGVPIIFLTTESDDSIRADAKAAGATGWITKPFDPAQLIRIVDKVLAK